VSGVDYFVNFRRRLELRAADDARRH